MRYGLMTVCAMLMTWAMVMDVRGIEVPVPVSIPLCDQAPKLDGNLDDSAWGTALTITNFVIVGEKDGFPPATNVTAKIMRNAEWLFIGFDIKHSMPALIVPRVRHRDERVQGENCVKVAFDPGTDGKQWYHIRLSAGNVISDQRNLGDGADLGWNIPMRSATRITETGWQAEIALPFAMLLDVGDPAKARIDLLAYTFTPKVDLQGIATGEETREVASWAPVQTAWWGAPERFIPIAGLADATFKAPFLPMLASAVVGAYQCTNGVYTYDVTGVARNDSSREGKVKIRVRDVPVAGQPGEALATVELRGGSEAKWSVLVPVASVVRRNIQVAMEDESGEALESMLIENPAVLDMFSAYLDRNYYTTEKEAVVVCRIGLPEEGMKGTLLRVRMDADDVLGETRDVRPLTEWSFPLQNVKEGAHPVRIEFRRSDGALISDQAVKLIKRAPKPGCEWKIDHANRVILNNGKPFFPFGVCFNTTNEVNYKELGEAGFNSIMYWPHGNPANAQDIMTMAEKHGLNVMMPPETFATNGLTGIKVDLIQGFEPLDHFSIRPFFKPAPCDTRKTISELTKQEKSRIFAAAHEANLERMLLGCRNIKDHPNLIGYNAYDEPRGPEYFDQWVQGVDLYNKVNREDGYHPWFVIAHPPEFDFCEVIGYDPYWVPGSAGIRGSPLRVVGWSRYYHQRAPARKVIWMVPLGENWSGINKRFILPQEQLCQTYLMLIDDVKALMYFCYPFTCQATFEVLATLAKQMQTLGPACVAPDVPQTITYSPGKMENSAGAPDFENKRYPDVLVKLFSNPQGGFILLAANSKNYPVNVEYQVSLLGKSGKVKRLFADDPCRVKDGKFTDKLENYGVRAYEIRSQRSEIRSQKPEVSLPAEALAGNQQSAVQIAVSMVSHPELEVREEIIPRSGRAGKKNIMPNPSFEEAALPGFPDYWKPNNVRPEAPDERTGRENALYSLDRDNPYHGKNSFRIRALPSREPMAGIYLSPQHERPTEYVWSFYLRADRAGVKVRLIGSGITGTPILALNREWQRYHVNVMAPGVGEYSAYWFRMVEEKAGATLWVDAVQFEQGVTPTEFEP